MNFQLRVDDVDVVYERATRWAAEQGRAHDAEIIVPIEERWYHVDVTDPGGRWQVAGPTEAGNRQFVLADPDGYLWRPFVDLGVRQAGE